MPPQNRPGFTWIELVVVLLVLGLALAVLLPFMNVNHGPARRATCMNNQHQLALALLNYESARGHFPGYVNRIGTDVNGRPIVASWVVPLFPALERQDLWEKWRSGAAAQDRDGDGNPDGYVFMTMLVCPSDPPAQTNVGSTSLAYVVNCGLPGDADTLADGVFFNHDVDSQPLRMSMDYLVKHDGTSCTLLLSENIQAGRWTDTAEADLGMVWRQSPGPDSGVNQGKNAGDRPQDIRYARPSSYHPDGVFASFCDGHQQFLADDLDYRVYQHLMTPDSSAAGVPGVLKDDDF